MPSSHATVLAAIPAAAGPPASTSMWPPVGLSATSSNRSPAREGDVQDALALVLLARLAARVEDGEEARRDALARLVLELEGQAKVAVEQDVGTAAALLEHYDRHPDDVKAELPLKRVWTLALEQEA